MKKLSKSKMEIYNELRAMKREAKQRKFLKRRDFLISQGFTRHEVTEMLAHEFKYTYLSAKNRMQWGGQEVLDVQAIKLDMIRLLKAGETPEDIWKYLCTKYKRVKITLMRKISIRKAYDAILKNKIQEYVESPGK